MEDDDDDDMAVSAGPGMEVEYVEGTGTEASIA